MTSGASPDTRTSVAPVCIAGMHRSGTSLMTRFLNLCGLYLGREDQLLGAGPGNADGHWEHEGLMQVNESLLAEFGGGWDLPPDLHRIDDMARLARHADAARAHLTGFVGHEPWGWKDPRNSLTLPFWRAVIGEVRVVWCVRNPLEVALSLRARNGSSVAFGLALWASYSAALLRSTTDGARVVTHYERYHSDPVREVARVAAWLGLPKGAAELDLVARALRPELRHSRFTTADLVEVGVSAGILALYGWLCAEAGASDLCGGHGRTRPDPIDAVAACAGPLDLAAVERLRARP